MSGFFYAIERTGMKAGSIEIELLAGVARLQADMDKANRTVGGAMQKIERQVTRTMRALGGVVGGVSFAAFVKSAIAAEIQLQKLNNTLKFATGSAATAAREIEFLRSTTARLGIEFNSAATAYGKLAASARGTSLEGENSRKVFEAVSKAAVVMGLSADEASGALLAISQMISKGTVQSEELRGQLGERLPGAFQIAARAMGVTTQELSKMLQQGQVITDDFLPKFADELNKTLGNDPDSAANSALANLNRLQNAWTEFKTSAAEGGIMTITLRIAEGSTNALKWFDHFVFGKGELADIQRRQGDIRNLEDAQKRLENLRKSWFASEEEILRQEKRVRDLQVKLNPSLRTPNAVPGMPSDNSHAGPNFGVLPSAQDINEIHRRQQAQETASKAIADQAIAEAKRVHDARLQDLQDQIDRETEMAEYRTKKEFEEAELRKQAEIDAANERAAAIAAINKKASDDYLRMVRQQEEQARREYERTSDNLTRAITDGLMRGFESGKSIAENFLDTLKNIFKSVILEPTIRLLVDRSGITSLGTAISSLLGSGAAFGETAGIPTQAGGGFGGILSTGKTLFDGITQGFKSLNFSITNSIAEFGANIANGMGGIRDAIGGFVGQNAGMIANGLAFLPAAFSLLKGDFKSAAFQGAGAAIGTAFGGPIGGAIGSFLGGAVGGLFGGKKEPPRTGAYVGGTFANGAYSPGYAVPYGSRYNAGFADSLGGLNSAFGQRLSGLLAGFGLNSTVGVSSGFNYKSKAAGNFDASFEGGSISFFSKYGKDAQAAFQSLIDTALGPLLIQAIQQTKLPQGIKQLFSAVSGTEQIDKLIAASINLNTAQEELADRFGLTVDAAAKVASATGLAGDAMIEFVNKLAGTAMSFKSQSEVLVETRAALIEGFQANTGEAITEAITRQVARQVQTRELVQGNWSMGGFSTAPVDRGTLLGGGQGPAYTASIMVTTTKTVFDTITDYVTKLLPSTKALPESLDEYDAVLKGIDKSTAAGIEQFEKLFAMREQFAQFTSAIDTLKAGVTGAVFSLMSPSQQLAQMQADLQTMFGNLGLTVPNSIQELMTLGNSIDYTTETGLDLAAAFPSLVQAFLNTKNGVEALATSLNELDPDRFRTLVDYRRAQAYARNGISLDMLPSYDVGTAYVPQDGPAMIHQGERIFTRTENGELMRRLSSKDDGMRVLADEVRGLREENRVMRDRLDKIADNTKRSRDVLEGSANGSTSLKTRTA